MVERSRVQMMAHALEMPELLLPFAGELLADLRELGSDPDLIAEVLDDLGLDADSFVIDLGSGKGAVSIEIARRVGCRVLGIDLHEGLTDDATRLARDAGVSERCRFVVGDLREYANDAEAADAAVFAALGHVLGPWDETIGCIRAAVRPGGLMVINDSFLTIRGASVADGFETYESLEGTRAALRSHGDTLVREVLESPAAPDAPSEEADLIEARAAAIKVRRPDLGAALDAFVLAQRDEYAFLESDTAGAVWVLQRGPD